MLSIFLSSLLASGPFRMELATEYRVESQNQSAQGKTKVRTIHGKSGTAQLTLTIFELPSRKAALEMQKLKLAQIGTLFEEHPTGYFAMVSRTTTCPQDFLPNKEEIARKHEILNVWTMFATERNSLGACSEDMAKKRAGIAILTCGTRLIHVEKFAPRADWTEADLKELRSVDCGG